MLRMRRDRPAVSYTSTRLGVGKYTSGAPVRVYMRSQQIMALVFTYKHMHRGAQSYVWRPVTYRSQVPEITLAAPAP
jgi:hypothetical protein